MIRCSVSSADPSVLVESSLSSPLLITLVRRGSSASFQSREPLEPLRVWRFTARDVCSNGDRDPVGVGVDCLPVRPVGRVRRRRCSRNARLQRGAG